MYTGGRKYEKTKSKARRERGNGCADRADRLRGGILCRQAARLVLMEVLFDETDNLPDSDLRAYDLRGGCGRNLRRIQRSRREFCRTHGAGIPDHG